MRATPFLAAGRRKVGRIAVCAAFFGLLAFFGSRVAPGPGAAGLPGALPCVPAASRALLREKPGGVIPAGLALLDEAARPVFLADLLDKPTLLILTYFRCAGTCSPQLDGIAGALGRVGAAPGKDFQVITVSFDPRDTPALAARKREAYLRRASRPLPPGAWRFLTGDAAATRALAGAVGLGFEPRGEGFAHAAVTVVLDAKGRVTGYLYGAAYDPEDVRRAVRGRIPVFSLPRCLGSVLAVGSVIALVAAATRRLFRIRL